MRRNKHDLSVVFPITSNKNTREWITQRQSDNRYDDFLVFTFCYLNDLPPWFWTTWDPVFVHLATAHLASREQVL